MVVLRSFLLLDELPPPDHGRSHPASFHVIMIEHQVGVNDSEDDEEPHQHVVPLAHCKISAHQRDDPGKEMWQPRVAHGSVHPEARDALEQEDKKRQEIREARKSIVSDGFQRLDTALQDIHSQDILHFFNLFFPEDDEIPPIGVFVAYETPEDPV